MSDIVKKVLEDLRRFEGRPRVPALPSDFAEIIDNEPQEVVLDNGASQQLLDRELVEGEDEDTAFVTDFEHRVEQGERAKYGPNGEVLEDMDEKFNLREIQREEANEKAPHACPNPPSWDEGILGNTVTVQPAQNTAVEGPTVPVVYWPGEERESLPVIITLTIGPMPTPAASSGIIRPFARIRWGTRSQFVVHVDIHRGTQIVVGGSSVFVDVGLDAGSDTPCQISAALSYWDGDKIAPATRTNYLGTINHGATSAVQSRPHFAMTILAVLRANGAAPLTINMVDLNNNVIAQVALAANVNLSSPLPLPNDCAGASISNTDGAIDTAFRLVWGMVF